MILAPEVHVCLEGNALRVEGGLSKIFIDAEYLLFRNYSAIQFTDLDPERMSPFSSNKVQDVGNLALVYIIFIYFTYSENSSFHIIIVNNVERCSFLP